MKTMQEEWKTYRDKVYPEGIPADQNRELHGAFFAGALCYLLAMDEIATLPNDEEIGMALEKLKREVWEINTNRARVARERN